MVAVEDLLGSLEIQLLRSGLGPREIRDDLEVGADDLRLRRLARDPLEPP